MENYFVINLESFSIQKEHPYTIFFKATCPTFNSREFNLEYTGPDLIYKVSLPSDCVDKVRNEMKDVFGYGPFDTKKVEQAMRDHRQFRVLQ